jgi:hypothetical protein
MDYQKFNELKDVSVKTHGDLKEAIKPFLDDNSSIRKLLIEGMDIAKRHKEYFEKVKVEIDEAEFGGYVPAYPTSDKHFLWVDLLIKKRLDGKRDDLKIGWSLPEGNFEFDPWSKTLTKK